MNTSAAPAAQETPGQAFAYEGPDALYAPIQRALREVVDPEVAMSIVDVGLVYGVQVSADGVVVRMTMTSAACPVTDVILGDVEDELARALAPLLPAPLSIQVELVWEPAWSTDRMSARAKAFMGW